MYQLIGLRPNRSQIKNVYHDYFFTSYEELVTETEGLIAKFRAKHPQEVYNLFYPAALTQPGDRTQFIEQEIVPFDFDEIDLAHRERYLELWSEEVGLPWQRCWVVWTGHGIQLMVRVQAFSFEFLKAHKAPYGQICKSLTQRFNEAGLPGYADTTSWQRSKLLRLPYTINRKPMDKPFSEIVTPVSADPGNLSVEVLEFPWGNYEEKIPKKALKRSEKTRDPQDFTPPDPEYVMQACPFMAHQLKTEGASATYQEWFAALGVTARLDDDGVWSHRISKGYPGYSFEETSSKHEECSKAGARTCQSIRDARLWACDECPHWERSNLFGTPANLRRYIRECPDDIAELYAREDSDEDSDKDLEVNTCPPCPKSGQRPKEVINEKKAKETVEEGLGKGSCSDQETEFERVGPTHIPPVDTSNVPPVGSGAGMGESRNRGRYTTGGDPGNPSGPHTEIDWTTYVQAGFSDVEMTKEGTVKKIIRKPNLLRDYYDSLRHYVVVADNDQVYVYRDGVYERTCKLEVKAFAQKHYRPKSTRDAEINEFYNKVLLSNQVGADFLTPAKSGHVNLRNGVLVLATGELLPHSPKYGFLYKLPYDYVEGAVCDVWDQLMQNVSCGDEEIIQAIEEFLGYCLYGGPYELAKILILAGGGENGKSTVIRVFEMVLGEKNCSGINVSDIRTNKFLAYELIGKLANFSEEEPRDCFKNPSNIKRLTGNSPIWVERKREQGHSFTNTAKMIMTYNIMPEMKDDSHGMKRRLLIVPFNLNLHERPDKKITDVLGKISAELPGILNRCVKRFVGVLAKGHFLEPKAGSPTMKQLVVESNDVYAWCQESIEVAGPDDRESWHAKTFEAYESFRRDCPGTRITRRKFTEDVKRYFAKEIAQGAVEYKVMTIEGKTHRVFRGMRVAWEQGIKEV